MTRWYTITGLMGIAAIAAITTLTMPEPAAAQTTVVCESRNNQRARCPMNTRGGVVLQRKLSSASCDGRWGVGPGFVFVDDGCRAEFRSARYNSDDDRRDRWDRDDDRRNPFGRNSSRALNQIYREVLGRNVDDRGYRTYSDRIRDGWSLEQVRRELASSDEARESIRRLYREVRNRDASSRTVRDYQRRLINGWTLREVRRDIARNQ